MATADIEHLAKHLLGGERGHGQHGGGFARDAGGILASSDAGAISHGAHAPCALSGNGVRTSSPARQPAIVSTGSENDLIPAARTTTDPKPCRVSSFCA